MLRLWGYVVHCFQEECVDQRRPLVSFEAARCAAVPRIHLRLENQ